MKIIHQIDFIDGKGEAVEVCKKLGLKINETFDRVEIAETDGRWPAVQRLMLQYKYSENCTNEFTESELMSAPWLRVLPAWHHGYPKPDNDFGYINITYDLTNHCSKCSIGKAQKAPFRMAAEPKWGSKDILQLNWVFDEYFVKPQLWEEVFKSFNIEKYPVLHYKTGKELETVVQLKIDSILEGPLHLQNLAFEICTQCNQKKYNPIKECGMTPSMSKIPSGISAVKSIEVFGSGGRAYRAVYFSQELFRNLYKKRIKGVNFNPVRND